MTNNQDQFENISIMYALNEMLNELSDDEFHQVEDFIVNNCADDGDPKSNFFRLLLLNR